MAQPQVCVSVWVGGVVGVSVWVGGWVCQCWWVCGCVCVDVDGCAGMWWVCQDGCGWVVGVDVDVWVWVWIRWGCVFASAGMGIQMHIVHTYRNVCLCCVSLCRLLVWRVFGLLIVFSIA